MISIINSCAIIGIDAFGVKVEVDVSGGLPAFDIVGLPDAAVRESKERVRTALINANFEFPLKRITVNLSPADIKKEGALFDLPIAIGILLATGQVQCVRDIAHSICVGELSLDGQVRMVHGVLSMGLFCGQNGFKTMIMPSENAPEAALCRDLAIIGVNHLRQLTAWLQGDLEIDSLSYADLASDSAEQRGAELDMADIKGQEAVKRAMEIAAAGYHNILMIGPPGSGKTMLARRLPTILPPMSYNESLETTRIFSVAALLPAGTYLMRERPFRAPHHTASAASIIGGGRVPRPGEVTLADNGILFLDELPEFSRAVLEALRQPLEDKVVSVSRVHGHMEFPARFQLVAAMNPCPCGHLNDPFTPCRCTPQQINRYMSKISGPLLDRIDLHISVQRVEYSALADTQPGESSADIRARVLAARNLQQQRFAGTNLLTNADMEHRHVEQYCRMTPDAQQMLKMAFSRLNLSARAHDRILKVARTIADLSQSKLIDTAHVAEAIQYRSLDRHK